MLMDVSMSRGPASQLVVHMQLTTGVCMACWCLRPCLHLRPRPVLQVAAQKALESNAKQFAQWRQDRERELAQLRKENRKNVAHIQHLEAMQVRNARRGRGRRGTGGVGAQACESVWQVATAEGRARMNFAPGVGRTWPGAAAMATGR